MAAKPMMFISTSLNIHPTKELLNSLGFTHHSVGVLQYPEKPDFIIDPNFFGLRGKLFPDAQSGVAELLEKFKTHPNFNSGQFEGVDESRLKEFLLERFKAGAWFLDITAILHHGKPVGFVYSAFDNSQQNYESFGSFALDKRHRALLVKISKQMRSHATKAEYAKLVNMG